MFTDPVTLIDQTTRNLEDIAELLHDEFDERYHQTLTRDGEVCRDAYGAIKKLLPKLRAARSVQAGPTLPGMRPQCINCD